MPEFNVNNFIIDRVRSVTQVNLETGTVDWYATSIEDPQIEFTGESTDKTDAQGVLLARFDSAKGVNFSGAASVISLPLMAAQLGTTTQVASSSSKLTGEDFVILNVGSDKKAVLPYTPTQAPTCVYTLSEDKNIDGTIDIGVGGENATISENEITMPDSFGGTQIGVLYQYEVESGVKISNGSENFASSAKYIVKILACDVCNQAVKRACTIVFPKAKIDNNFTIGLTTDGNHPFSFSALKDYCSDEAELCYVLFHENSAGA